MWNVEPLVLCKQHLLGEHQEVHTMVGTLKRDISIHGYLDGLYDISKIVSRHEELVREMLIRGIKHSSEILDSDKEMVNNWLKNNKDTGYVNVSRSLKSLNWRCKKCQELQRKNIIKGKIINVDKLKDLYNSGLSTSDLGKYFECDSESIRNMMEINNISLRQPSCYRKHNFNENFFDSIDSEEKAYMLGFIYADGSVSLSGGNYLSIQLHNKDRHILEKFLKITDATYEIKTYEGYPEITFSSKKMVEVLISKYGLVPNKSILGSKYPKLSVELERHFIRGFFDGNGWVTYNHKTNKDFQVGFSGHKNILENIKKVLFESCGLKKETKIIFDKNNQTGMFMYGGNNQILKIMSYLYKDATIYLNRKFEKFQLLKLRDKL